ncbi:radical SAM protein [Pseudomonas chlororaphis]|uniref:radical SAM protein n=1 Tax=Pseudomonas chlororaphis TaxID=587753 RepID=UPI000D11183D|nr:radical SAM protein [Pseudomonas chlororaphis]AVO59322.1 hypothetical protein C6Q18_15590 [Pseudomonas chlororaphis subsp. piscium]
MLSSQATPDSGLEDLYRQCAVDTLEKIASGQSGTLRLSPNSIWLNISDNCNLKCVGCYSEGKFKKNYVPLEEIKKSIQFSGNIAEISFTTNEALLHPQFCEIIDMCRDMHPQAKLWVITNGTIPIKGRYKAAIAKLDKVGLSIDGASKETFENIRIGARFEDFINNTKAIIAIRNETGSPKEITFSFTATSTNLHELIDVVRLGHSLGVSDIWAQAMEAKDDVTAERISNILIDTLSPERRTRLIDDARSEAARLGIGLYYSQGIYPPAPTATAPVTQPQQEERSSTNEWHVKMCQYPWIRPVQISKGEGGYVVRPCCYISTTKTRLLAQKYGLIFPEVLTGEEIYNSTQLWQFRKDLVLGKTADVCADCNAARGFPWKPTMA